MLDGDDPETRAGVRELELTLQNRRRPVGLWLGAGTSAWAGLPTWQSLADNASKTFKELEPAYGPINDQLIRSAQYPQFFSSLRSLNPQRLNAFLISGLASTTPSSVFRRFTSLLSSINRLKIVTTNFDDSLQSRLSSNLVVFHRSDIEAVVAALPGEQSFLLK